MSELNTPQEEENNMSEVIFVDFKKRQIIKIEKRQPKPKGTILAFPCAPGVFGTMAPTFVMASIPAFGAVDSIAMQFKADILCTPVQIEALTAILQENGWKYEDLAMMALGMLVPPPMEKLTFKQAVEIIQFGNAHTAGA
jgi:hypothetical protein